MEGIKEKHFFRSDTCHWLRGKRHDKCWWFRGRNVSKILKVPEWLCQGFTCCAKVLGHVAPNPAALMESEGPGVLKADVEVFVDIADRIKAFEEGGRILTKKDGSQECVDWYFDITYIHWTLTHWVQEGLETFLKDQCAQRNVEVEKVQLKLVGGELQDLLFPGNNATQYGEYVYYFPDAKIEVSKKPDSGMNVEWCVPDHRAISVTVSLCSSREDSTPKVIRGETHTSTG